MSELIGKSLGSYRILEQIGIGGMATIYKAYQPGMDRYVAIKVLPHYLAGDEQFVHRFQREARAIANLEHPHILPVFDYGEHDGITYIAMRYVEAGTLKEHMAQGQMSLTEISHVISQIGGALDYAHRQGIIHRDVKPGNILIDDQGNTYLTDFGLARIMESSQQFTASGVSVGTPAYMSPEQGKGIKVDHRSDIYSLGIMLYEMVTRQVPFEAETPLAVLLKHITDPLPLPRKVRPDIPEPVELVVLRALAKEPGDRFQSANELAQALATVISRTAPHDQPSTPSTQPPIKPASTQPAPEQLSLITRAQHTWQTPRGKAMMIGGTAVLLILFGFLINWLNRSDVAISGGTGEETAVTEPSPTPQSDTAAAPRSTTESTTLPANNLQLQFRITSTSDWAEVSLLSGIDILNHSTVETGEGATLAAMRDRIIDLDQDSEQAAEGNPIFMVQDITLDASSANDTIGLAIAKGCIGVTMVEVFNVVTGAPLLLDRFSNETCESQTYSISTSLLTTANVPPTPTNEPPGLHEIYPIAPGKGQVVNWCEDISPPQLCSHDLASDEITVLTEDLNFTEMGARAWSPDGRQILFSAGEDQSDHDLFLINTDGSNLRKLTDSSYSDHESEWSPNGEQIIFVRNCGLWSIRPDGTEEQLLMHSNDYCVEAVGYSPDSETIAFTAFRDGAVRDIWRVNANGGNPQRLYAFGDEPPRSGSVVWLPDNERMLFWFWVDGIDEEQRLLIYADGSGVAGTVDGAPYWWQRNYYPRWGIEGVEIETAVTADNPVEQARAFADPILTVIANHPPDYADDFSDSSSGWPSGSLTNGSEWGYEDGAYVIVASYPQGCCVNVQSNSMPFFSDFVMELDTRYVSEESGAWTVLFREQHGPNVTFPEHYGFSVYDDGDYRIWKNINQTEILLKETNVAPAFMPDQVGNHLTIVAHGSQFAFFLNDEPLWFIDDESLPEGRFSLAAEGWAEDFPLRVQFDNLEIWDISNMETAVSTADEPVSETAPESVDQAGAFAEPILTAIAGSPPLYNMNNLGLPVGAGVSGHSSQAEGEAGFIGEAYFVKIATGGTESHACYGGDTSANLPADFVMEIDGRFLPDTNPNEDDWQIQFRKWGFGNFYVLIIRQDGHINLVRHGNNESVDLAAYYGFPVLSEPDTNHVQLIASGSETAVYVNGEQVIYIDDPDYTDQYGAGTINLGICNLGESPREVRWNNLKVWDISGLLDE